jgi:hypothetical protein
MANLARILKLRTKLLYNESMKKQNELSVMNSVLYFDIIPRRRIKSHLHSIKIMTLASRSDNSPDDTVSQNQNS